MTNYIIRPIEEKDIEGFNKALDIVCREKKYLSFTQAPPLEKSYEYVRDNLEKNNPFFVVEQDNKIIGWCDIVRETRESRKHGGCLGLGLLAQFRNQGIGRKLMVATLNEAQKQGFLRVELSVFEHNTNAIKLYKKLGFEIEGLIRQDFHFDGVYHGSYIMSILYGPLAP